MAPQSSVTITDGFGNPVKSLVDNIPIDKKLAKSLDLGSRSSCSRSSWSWLNPSTVSAASCAASPCEGNKQAVPQTMVVELVPVILFIVNTKRKLIYEFAL